MGSNKLGKYSEAKDESRDKEHIVILKNVNDINSLINHQEEPDVKGISALKINPSNFSKFIDNYGIIKRLFEEENKSIQFIARWLRMSKSNFQLGINRYFKHLRKYNELIIKHKLKEEIISKIKSSIVEFLDINKRKWVTVLEIVEFINNGVFKDNQDNKTNYYEVYSCLKNKMKFGWRKHLNVLLGDFKIGLRKLEKCFNILLISYIVLDL